MKYLYTIILSAVGLFLLSPTTLAHQPRITEGENTVVEEPEISKAYYAELTGRPHFYTIDSSEEFNLYVNILSPDIEGAETDYAVSIFRQEGNELTEIGYLDPRESEWSRFYEEFAGDSYLMGGEFEQVVDHGIYVIEVVSDDNQGKYVLATGRIESFPPDEIANTVVTLPSLKKDFFGKSPLTAFNNLTGIFLGVGLVFIIIVFLVLFWVLRKKRRNKKSQK